MKPRPLSTIGWVVVAGAVLLVGSLLYWMADGRVGTPGDFRQRVADVGLTVDWSNSGPRAGAGSVETSCGPVDVEIDEIDGVLWFRWEENREVATDDAIQALLSCSPLHEEGDTQQR